MSGGRIRLVLFDLDDTLFAHRASVELGIAAHRAALGGAIAAADAPAEAARWNALEEEHYHRYLGGELDFLGQRRARARGFLAPYGVELDDAAAEAWFATYLVEYERSWALHADAAPCLDALAAAGIAVGLITNGEHEFQAAKVRGTGLDARIPVERMVASGEVGVAKPDRRIFDVAAARFGVAVGEAAYVGDRLGTDALGAAAAGMLGVWLDRGGVAGLAESGAAGAGGGAGGAAWGAAWGAGVTAQLAALSAAGGRRIRSLSEVPALVGA